MKLIIYFSILFCSSPLSSPIFKKSGSSYIAELPFSRDVNVRSYEIMVGNLDAKENDFISVDKKRDQQGIKDSIRVKLDAIKNKDNKHLYSICVEEYAKKPKKWYSESFRYDVRKNIWVLDRAYEDDPWYIKHKLYIMGGSAIFGVGLIAWIIMRYMKKKTDEEDL